MTVNYLFHFSGGNWFQTYIEREIRKRISVPSLLGIKLSDWQHLLDCFQRFFAIWIMSFFKQFRLSLLKGNLEDTDSPPQKQIPWLKISWSVRKEPYPKVAQQLYWVFFWPNRESIFQLRDRILHHLCLKKWLQNICYNWSFTAPFSGFSTQVLILECWVVWTECTWVSGCLQNWALPVPFAQCPFRVHLTLWI